jgi:polyhydroxybutyrate depolymerase
MHRLTVRPIAAALAMGLGLAPTAAGADAVSERRVDAAPLLAALAENMANAPGWHEKSLKVGPAQRWYRVYVPRNMADGFAVVVALHGGTQSMREIFAQDGGPMRAWQDIADRDGVLLLAPNGTDPRSGDARGDNQTWNDLRTEGVQRNPDADDVGFIVQLTEWAHTTFRTDRSRAYVTGASNGGMMTYRLLIEAPERFAAAAAFIANLPDGSRLVRPPAKPTPLLIMNGTLDRIVRWDGGPVVRNRGRVVSSGATFSWWIAANRAAASPAVTETLPDRDAADECRLVRAVHEPQRGGSPVVIYTMEGGGHAMPSIAYADPGHYFSRRFFGPFCHDAEGAELAWEFLRQHRRG